MHEVSWHRIRIGLLKSVCEFYNCMQGAVVEDTHIHT